MNDFRRWKRRAWALFGGAIAVALVWPCVAMMRGTTADDWYAALKLTVAEAMIGVGFNPLGATHYRAPDGTVGLITRRGLTEYGVPIEARERILYTALVGALHGGLAGALIVVLFIMLWRAVNGWRILRAERPVRPPGQGPAEIIETWDPSGIAEGLPAKVGGDARTALWVLSASQAARLMEALGAANPHRALPAQRSLERANTPLLPAADTAGTNAESANPKPKTAGAAAKKGRSKAGDGGKPRASSDQPAPDSEDGLAELDDGGDVNWL